MDSRISNAESQEPEGTPPPPLEPAMQSASSSQPKNITKRTLPSQDSDDEDDDSDFDPTPGTSKNASSRKKRRRTSEDKLVYIGKHIEQPLICVWARFSGAIDHVWTQAAMLNNEQPVDDWSEHVSFDGQIKTESINLDPIVARGVSDDAGTISRSKKMELVKEYLTSGSTSTEDLLPYHYEDPYHIHI